MSSETVEEVMEESAATSSSSIQEKYNQKGGFSPPTNSFKVFNFLKKLEY